MLKALLSLILLSGTAISNNLPANTETNILLTGKQMVIEEQLKKKVLDITLPPGLKKKAADAPLIQASSALVYDLNSGVILYQKNIDTKQPIASITKLMTAIIILEENDLNEIATIKQESTQIGGVKIWLYTGEKITIANLLRGALIPSGNDAAHALAIHNSGSINLFVQKMNQKGQILGLKNSHFANPMGFDDPENYSTAEDLVTLSKYALKKKFIRDTVKISHTEVISENGKIKHELSSTNKLLTDSDIIVKGLKTGNTENAGLCFIGLIQNTENHEFVSIVLNSPARFTETKTLSKWIIDNYI